MIKNENFITIQGWMINDLNLKGNNLLIYAIIYSFSQDGKSSFHGSLDYLEEWTNSTKAGVIKNLNTLIAMGLLSKEECAGGNKYIAIVPDIVNKVDVVGQQSLPKEVNKVDLNGQQSLPNNINNITNNKYIIQVELQDKCDKIISYLNTICNTNYKSNTNSTKRLVRARLNEGYTLDDFKTVIDIKYKDWGEKPFKFSNGEISSKYLRPSTLFSDKFDNYLNEASIVESSEVNGSVSSPVDTDVSTFIFK